jgi:FMN phosphatase YigB (HAD superfamily)
VDEPDWNRAARVVVHPAAPMLPPALAVTFDFGQTLCDLDTAMLSRRLAERGLEVPADRLDASVIEAWSALDSAIRTGHGDPPWKVLMRRLLTLAGGSDAAASDTVDWLWNEHLRNSFCRRPIAGMIELVRALRGAGVPVGIVFPRHRRLGQARD